jgi:ferredoxin
MDVLMACIGAGVCLALWAVVYRKVAATPRTVWEIVRQERAAEVPRAQSALQEAAAVRVGAIVKSLRDHEDQVAASYRAQLADAENRARVIERRASDAGVALGAASELVREVRSLRDELRALILLSAPQPAPGPAGGDPDRRETTELPRPPPGLTPPGSAAVLPSGPALTAAGLGPRPSQRPGPRPTLLGIRPALTPPPLRAPDADEEERESSEELTRVGERPPASALAMTLPSMVAVTPPSAARGGGS